MKKFKQVLAILLSVMLVFAALPISAIAEGTETSQSADSVITGVVGLSTSSYRVPVKAADTGIYDVSATAGKWGRFQDGTMSAGSYSSFSHKFGPSAATYARNGVWVYGGIAVNMALADAPEAFGFYIDTTSANGYNYVTPDDPDTTDVLEYLNAAGNGYNYTAKTAYEKVYFDIAFRNTTDIPYVTSYKDSSNVSHTIVDATNTQFVLGSANSVNFNIATTAAWSKGGYIPAGAIKLFNVETGSYVDAEYDYVNGEYINCSGFAVPYGFRGYVVVDLTNYDDVRMALADVKQIAINKHGFVEPSATATSASVTAERNRFIEQTKKYGANAGGACVVALDNFFKIGNLEAFNANAAKHVAQVGRVVPDADVAVSSTYSGEKEITFSATGMDGVSNVTYSVYSLNSTDSDTYDIVAQTSSKLDTTGLDGSYFVQAHGYKDGVLVASNLGTFTICAHSNMIDASVAADYGVEGYKGQKCSADCGYAIVTETYPAKDLVDDVVTIDQEGFKTNYYGAIRPGSVSYQPYGTTVAGVPAWGPSLSAARLEVYTGELRFRGVRANLAFNENTDAFGFYLDTTANTGDHNYFDLAFRRLDNIPTYDYAYNNADYDAATGTLTEDGETGGTWSRKAVLGSRHGNFWYSEHYNRDNSFSADPIQLYNIDTGEVTNAVIDYVPTEVNSAGFHVPVGFRGYVIVDLTKYIDSDQLALTDVKQVIVERHYHSISETYTPDETIREANKNKYEALDADGNVETPYYTFDNFFNIYDLAEFNKDIAAAVSKIGTIAPDAGMSLTATTGKDTFEIATTGMDAVNNLVYNIYKLDANEESYVLVDSITETTYAGEVGTYYVQAVGKDANGVLVASNLATALICAHENFTSVVTPPTATDKGYTSNVCDNCGYSYIIDGTDTPAIGVVSNLHSLGAQNMANDSDADFIAPEGTWGKSWSASGAILKNHGVYANGSLKWGPSLKHAELAIWNGTGIGITVTHTLNKAQGFGFYIDLNAAEFEGDNIYYDIAFSEQSIVNTSGIGYWKWILGSYRHDYDDRQQNNYFADSNPVKLYSIDTGTYVDATMDFEDILENESGFAVPKGFRGYVIIDMTSYNGKAMELADVKSIRVDIHRNQGDYPDFVDKPFIFDNFFNINDIALFEDNIGTELAKLGTFYPTENETVTVDIAENLTSITASATLDGATYNLYTLAEDGDTLVLTESNTTGEFAISQRVEYYVQAVVYSDGVVTAATDAVKVYTCDHANITDKVVAPTCTKGGYIEHTCDGCGHTWTTDPTPIDENAHDWGEFDVTPATRVTAGSQTRTCKHNASHTETEEIPATGTPEFVAKYGELKAALETLKTNGASDEHTEYCDAELAALYAIAIDETKDEETAAADMKALVDLANIKAGMLNTKFQIAKNNATGAVHLRLVSSIAVPVLENGEFDLAAFDSVGFKITIGENETIDFNTDKIYKEIKGTVNGTDISYTVKEFYDGSNFFFTVEIHNIPESAFDTEISVQAYYVESGSEEPVCGVLKTRTVRQFLDALSGN